MTSSGPLVEVSEGRLRVTNWETATPEIVRYFEAHAAGGGDDGGLAALLERVLKVGVLALETAGVSVNVHYVEKEFERLLNQMGSSGEQHVREIKAALERIFVDEAGVLPEVLRRYLGEGGRLEEFFDPERRDSAIGRIQELLQEHFGGEGSTLYRLLDLTNSSSPLHKWYEEQRESFESLRRLIENYRSEMKEQLAAEKARGAMFEKTSLKGKEFEERVFYAINEIAQVFGDVAEPTGDQQGLGGSKAGDTVAIVNVRDTRGASVHLVFESKDKPVGLTPIIRELEEAQRNRDAVAGIAVYSREDHMPSGTAPFRELGNGKYVCLYSKDSPADDGGLQLAYRAARFWVLADLHRDTGMVDARGISEDLEAARGRLKTIASLKSQLTKVKSSVEEGVEKVQRDLDELNRDLVKILDRIDERIRAVGTDPDSSVASG